MAYPLGPSAEKPGCRDWGMQSCAYDQQLPYEMINATFQHRLYATGSAMEDGIRTLVRLYPDVTCGVVPMIEFSDTVLPVTFLHMGYAEQRIVWVKRHELFLWARSVECRRKQFLLIGVLLNVGAMRHANALLIDRRAKTIELFDPHGHSEVVFKTETQREMFYSQIKSYISDVIAPSYTFYKPHDYCPTIRKHHYGIQSHFNTLHPNHFLGGSCVVWTLWYINNRLRNPTLPAAQVLEESMHYLVGPDADVGKGFEHFLATFTNRLMTSMGVTIHQKPGFVCKNGQVFPQELKQYATGDCIESELDCAVTRSGRQLKCFASRQAKEQQDKWEAEEQRRKEKEQAKPQTKVPFGSESRRLDDDDDWFEWEAQRMREQQAQKKIPFGSESRRPNDYYDDDWFRWEEQRLGVNQNKVPFNLKSGQPNTNNQYQGENQHVILSKNAKRSRCSGRYVGGGGYCGPK
jgi:hypothetical protein